MLPDAFAPDALHLAELPSVPLHQRQTLPELAACYFVLEPGGDVLYIGKTGNLRKRFLSHHRLADFAQEAQPVRVTWLITTDAQLLSQIERLCIDFWRPRYNQKPLPAFLTMMVPPALMEELDTYMTAQQEERPLARLTRSDVCRDILETFLTHQRTPRSTTRPTKKKGTSDAA